MTRKTWHYDEELGKMVEGPGRRRTEGSGDGWKFSDRYLDGARAPDGTDISSRKKHRDYMKKNNLTTIDDFTNTWKTQEKEREKFFKGDWDRDQRRQDIADAINRRTRSG